MPETLTCLVLIVSLLAALSGCTESLPTPKPVATEPVAREIASPQPTTRPSRTSTPVSMAMPTTSPQPPTPTPTPPLSEVDLGAPGGDCYGVEAMVADPEGGTLYVLCEHTDQGPGHTLVAVHGTSGQRLDSVLLGSKRATSGLPVLSLDPRARRLYLANTDLESLVVLDADTLAEVGRLPGVLKAVPAPGVDRFYTVTEQGLTAYRASDLTELGALPAREAPLVGAVHLDLVYNPANDRLYVQKAWEQSSQAEDPGILILNGGDLTLETTVPLSGTYWIEGADSRTNRVYLRQDRQILSIDGETQAVTAWDVDAIPERSGLRRLFFDPKSGRIHFTISESREPNFWLVLDGETLQPVQQVEGLPPWGALALGPGGDLLAVRQDGQPAEVVLRYDPDTGQVSGRLVLGRRLWDVKVDPGTDQVYVLDSAGGLTVLDGVELRVIKMRPDLLGADHPGLQAKETALGLDPERRRLFVVDRFRGETLAFDLDTLESAGRLGVAGPMAVDAGGGRLFIGDEQIYVYDTASLEPVGDEPALRLEGSADGMYAAPWPEDIVFDSGRLFIRLNSGGVKASFAIVSYTEFDPDSLESLGFLRVEVGTAAHSPVVVEGDNRVWLSYEGDFRHGLGAYAEDYVQLGFLKGLSGQLLADTEHLYLLRDYSLLVLDPERGYPLGALPLAGETWGAILDDVGDRFYWWGWNRLASLRKADLLASVSRPQPGLVPEDAGDMIYPSPNVDEDRTLFAVIPDTLESRSKDGSETWRPFTGIYRSKDGGQTWQLTTWGIQNYSVEHLSFDQEYETNHTLHAVAGALFRSEDDGQTWQPDSLPDLAFVSDRTGDKEIYTMYYGDLFLPFGTEPQRLTYDPADDDHPAWSADGKRLVFQSDRSGNLDLWIVNHDGTGLVQLTSDPADDLLPAWSPDGQLIAFTSLRDGSPAGYVVHAPEPGQAGDESGVTRLIDLPSVDLRPQWSDDAWLIAFLAVQGQDDRVLIVDRDGANPSQFSRTSDGDALPDLAGSGYYQIYADSELSGNFDLYHVYDTGPSIRRLTTNPSDETAPAELSLGLLPPRLHTPLRAWPAPAPSPPALPPEALITAENAGLVAKQGCWTEEGASMVVFSPDGRLLAVGGDGSFHLYDATTLAPVFSGKVGEAVADLAFHPEGRLLAVAAGPTVDLWDVSDCPEAGERCAGRLTSLDAQSEGSGATSLAFSPDGKLLVADSRLGSVLLWRVGGCASGAEDCGTLWYIFPSSGFRAFSPDGQILALGAGTVRPLYRVGDCESQSDTCLVLVGLLHGADALAEQTAWSPDGETLAFMGGSSVWLFDVSGCATGQGTCGGWLRTVEQPSSELTAAFGPDGTVAASGGYSGMVHLWKIDDGSLLQTLRDAHDTVGSLAFSPGHAALASVGWHGDVCVWHLLPEPRNPDRGALLYQDDFSDPHSGWRILIKDDYEIGYQEGAYRLAVDRSNTVVWGDPKPALSLDDFAIEVDARLLAGSLDSNFGLVIRLDPDHDRFYLFQIDGDGAYNVVLRAEGEWTTLVRWTPTDAINRGLGVNNHLHVICDGERFSFYVNGIQVADLIDGSIGSGSIGLAVGTHEEPGTEVRFDNLKVYGLEE